MIVIYSMKRCYFCATPTSDVKCGALPNIQCVQCSLYTKERLVYTYFLENEPIYAGIEIRKRGTFIFTLFLKEQITYLSDGKELDITIHNLSINPFNAIQKLNIYLTFL